MNPSDIQIICLVHDDFEDLELWYPILRLQEEKYKVHLVGESNGKVYTGKYGVKAAADFGFAEINPTLYDGLLIPGGWAPDKLRRYDSVLTIVQHFDSKQKPIAQICHAGWVLISAKVLEGRTVTSTPGIKDDMINAGATWKNEPVVVDRNLVSSRRPSDLPEFALAFINLIKDYKAK